MNTKTETKDLLGINRVGNAILCYGWGETDRPEACLARTVGEVRHFLIQEAFGDDNDPMLDEWMEELAKWDWREDGRLKWEFEIGGVYLEDVAATLGDEHRMDWLLKQSCIIVNGLYLTCRDSIDAAKNEP